jgi:sirohydrochlorin cobaltochelatase
MDSLHAAVRNPLTQFLSELIELGYCRVGQILISKNARNFLLRHELDEAAQDLQAYHSTDDASEIARWDDSGEYRPLKTAPNLRRGWELHLQSTEALRLALDLLYPAALANWRAVLLEGGKIAPPLRETLNRQTGMYRITGLLTRDDASQIITTLCRPGCLRQILWPIETGDTLSDPIQPEGRIPLFCTNTCSLFLGKAREIVNARPVES